MAPRVVGIDPGTVSIDLVGLEDGAVWLDRTLPTAEALDTPGLLADLLTDPRPPDLIAGPSGYGLPLTRIADLTETDLRLAFLATEGETGGIGGLRRLVRRFRDLQLPMVFTPGVMHLPSVPDHRKLNRVDLGTADKVAVAALAIWRQARDRRIPVDRTSFILLELGGAFTAGLAVEGGAIVDGVGGTSGPIGWQSAGGWDGEVAYLAGTVGKELLFVGGAGPDQGAAYVEGAVKTAAALRTSLAAPSAVYLSGRHAADPAIRAALEARLSGIAPVLPLAGYATRAKQGAQGAALIADGLAGGAEADLVRAMRLREAGGTVLDHLRVISPEAARRRLGLT